LDEYGATPVMKLALEGEQTGALLWALLKRIALLANRSIFGVLVWGLPPITPTKSFKSSSTIITTLGFSEAFKEKLKRIQNNTNI